MAKLTETEMGGEKVVLTVLDELDIKEYSSVRVWDGDKEVVLRDLKVVVYYDSETIALTDEENIEVLSIISRTKDRLLYNIGAEEEFPASERGILNAMSMAITKDIIKESIESEYCDNEGILALTDGALLAVRKYFEDYYNLPEDTPVSLEFCDAVFEFVRLQGIKMFNVDIADKKSEPYILKNTGKNNYYVKEYEAGEFGIYDKKDDKLYADCFESTSDAQEWYDRQVKHNKKLRELNNAIFEDVGATCKNIEKRRDKMVQVDLNIFGEVKVSGWYDGSVNVGFEANEAQIVENLLKHLDKKDLIFLIEEISNDRARKKNR